MEELSNMISGINEILKQNGYNEAGQKSESTVAGPKTAKASTVEAPKTEESTTGKPLSDVDEIVAKVELLKPHMKKSSKAPTDEDKYALAFKLGLRDDYVKEMRKLTPERSRADLREEYKRVRAAQIRSGVWKNRPTQAARRGETTAVETLKVETPATPLPRDEQPFTPQQLLEEIDAKARVLFGEGEDSIKAIAYVREATSFDLLTAKLWVDCIRDPDMTVPIPLQQAKDAFVASLLSENGASLDTQVQAIRKAQIDAEMDPAKGKAEGQFKIDLAGDKKQGFVQIARRIARELAANGPISIDHVTAKMAEMHNVMPEKGKRKHQWKGSVFAKSEWQYVGDVPSAQASAHGRPVGLWALKSWLKDNTLNGKSTHVSSFVLSRLFSDFKRIHPKVGAEQCNCYVGEERLSEDIRQTIIGGDNKIYNMPVTFCPGSVGAMIFPPSPAIGAGLTLQAAGVDAPSLAQVPIAQQVAEQQQQ